MNFFNSAGDGFRSGARVTFDFSNTVVFSESAAAVLTAHVKDRTLNHGLPSSIVWPSDPACKRVLARFNIFKRIGNDTTSSVVESSKPIKVSDLKVANETAKQVVDFSSTVLYGKPRKIRSLYAILIEVMANTNNHATSDCEEGRKHPWWLFTFIDDDRSKVILVFVDLGVGLFSSLPVKQYIRRNPSLIRNDLRRDIALANIWDGLTQGKIRSRTGDPSRGRGIPLISDSSESDDYSNFIIIANDAYLDLKEKTTSAMREVFSGTLFQIEISRAEV